MNRLRSTVIAIAMFGVVLAVSGVSFADPMANAGHHQAKIKLLQDSAAALQQSNPALAKKLTDYATQEMKETQEHKEGTGTGKEPAEANEKQSEENHQVHIKLLRDSAAALQASQPTLAADLTKSADRMSKKAMKAQKEDAKEKGE